MTTKQLDEFEAYLNELAKNVTVKGCNISVYLPRVRPALEPNEQNLALINRLNEIWVDCGMTPLQSKISLGGSDAANVSASGVPTVDNLGIFGGKIHTTEEYAVLSSLAHQAKRIALAAMYI